MNAEDHKKIVKLADTPEVYRAWGKAAKEGGTSKTYEYGWEVFEENGIELTDLGLEVFWDVCRENWLSEQPKKPGEMLVDAVLYGDID